MKIDALEQENRRLKINLDIAASMLRQAATVCDERDQLLEALYDACSGEEYRVASAREFLASLANVADDAETPGAP